jgi:two-component system, response regulator PdtaR
MAEYSILIVEDETVVAMLIEQAIKGMGYQVAGIASRGNDAIRLARETTPDLIIMDIMLKGSMDGIETAEQIHVFSDIPVIYLTAYSDDDMIKRATQSNPYGFLIKPFKMRELYANIEAAIHKYHQDRRKLIDTGILDSTLALVPTPIITTDSYGRINRANPAAEQLSGWNSGELREKHIWDLIGPSSGTAEEGIPGSPALPGPREPSVVQWPEETYIVTKTGNLIKTAVQAGFIRKKDPRQNELLFTLRKQG